MSKSRRWEKYTPSEKTLGALSDLVHADKVRYIGSSTFPASQIVEAQWTAERRGRRRFVWGEAPFSILLPGGGTDLPPPSMRYGVGVVPRRPPAGRWVPGPLRAGHHPAPRAEPPGP